MKKTLSGIMWTLLLIGMLTLAFNIQPAKAETPQLELTMSFDKTTIVIGDVVDFNLTLRNIGNETLMIFFSNSQRFDVYLYRNGMIVARWSDGKVFLMYVWELYLEPNETFSRILEWDFFQWGSPPKTGIYEIEGSCVGEPAVVTGQLTIELILLEDLNKDGTVDINDIHELGKAFGSYPRHPRWNARADLNEDGKVNIYDVWQIAIQFGKPL